MTDQFASLILSSPFQNSLFVVGGVILLGFILSRLKINSFRIGVTGVLIVGVIAVIGLEASKGFLNMAASTPSRNTKARNT